MAKVGFEDQDGFKVRPVLIIDGTSCCVLSLKITSHVPREGYDGEYQIIEWKEAGLMKPSTIRITKRLSLPTDSFLKRIGRLMPLDCENVSKIYSEMFPE